ncbi:hypothetical protein E4U41_003587, partial [Claviceps citrina]
MADHLDDKRPRPPARPGKEPGKEPSSTPRTRPRPGTTNTMMRSLLAVGAAAAGLWLATCTGHRMHDRAGGEDGLGDFIAQQGERSLQGVLANIGAGGSGAGGAAAGIVVASPSKRDPDYFYTWTRDAALTAKVLVERLIAGEGPAGLRTTMQQYVAAQAALQD